MKNGKHCTMILLSGGSGKRMGTDMAKQYLMLKGKPVICHCLDTIQNSSVIDDCVMVIRREDEEYVKKEILSQGAYSKVTTLVYSGAERYQSVWNGLSVIDRDRTDMVFIHDGARPFMTEDILERCYRGTVEHGACVAAVPSKDTVKIVDEDGRIVDTPNRKYVWNIQTPQVFETELIYNSYARAINSDDTTLTDDSQTVEKYSDKKVFVVMGDYSNIKVTTPEDMIAAEGFLTVK